MVVAAALAVVAVSWVAFSHPCDQPGNGLSSWSQNWAINLKVAPSDPFPFSKPHILKVP